VQLEHSPEKTKFYISTCRYGACAVLADCVERADLFVILIIGIMIGAYIILRCLELVFANGSRYANDACRGLMVAAAVLCIALMAFLTKELVLTGLKADAALPPGLF
jgi:hypothetical protein